VVNTRRDSTAASSVVVPPIPEFEQLIHEKTRLAIVSALKVNPKLTFVQLRDILGTTEGNLSLHMRKLEKAKYVSCWKSFAGRRPRTEFALTVAGKLAFERYLQQMETVIQASRG
jgi:DNA-binding MarR family transcriptional regulator